MNSDEERSLFELWGWSLDHIRRAWISPEHGHAQFASIMLRRTKGRRPESQISLCQQTLSIDDVVAATRTPEGEGALVGFVMSHGVRKR